MKTLRNFKQLLMQLLMLDRINGLFSNAQWSTLIDSVPPMRTACDQQQDMVTALLAKLAEYREVITWVAAQKRVARKMLAETSFTIMSPARAWAIKNGDDQIAFNTAYTLADLSKMGFQTLLNNVMLAQNLLEPHLAALLPYGVTPEMFAAWKTKHADLDAFMKNGPKSAINTRKRIGSELLADMKSTMEFFDTQITPLMGGFFNTPAFYNQFRLESIIGNGNIHHTRLLAHCTDELGTPVYGIIVTVDRFTDPRTGKTYDPGSGTTDADGNAEVIEFFAGNRTVTLSGSNIQTTTFPAIQFERGRAISYIFTVKPAFFNIPAPQQSKEKAEK